MAKKKVVAPPQKVSANHSQAIHIRRILVTRQLVLLFHAHQCLSLDKQANGRARQCRVVHCNLLKGVLSHMINCSAFQNCPVAHCSSSRQILSHWKHCIRPDCPICHPFKESNP